MRRLLPFVLVTACGHGNAKPDAVITLDPDSTSGIDAPLQPSTVTVTVFSGPPALVAYRDGQGPWQTPTATMILPYAFSYDITVTDDYMFVIACADSTGFETQTWASTTRDNPPYLFCNKNVPQPAPVVASGHMTQSGSVFMSYGASSPIANWDFQLGVPPGLHDLVALDSDHILIRRDQTISAATTLSPIDVVAQGSPLVPVTLTLDGRTPGDTLYTDLELGLQNDFGSIEGSSTTLMTPPASLLKASDTQYLHADVRTPTSYRAVDSNFTGTQTSFTFAAPLTTVTFDTTGGTLSAGWQTLPDFSEIELYAYVTGTGNAYSQQAATFTRKWLAKQGMSRVAFDAMPPGYDPSWKIDLSGPYARQFDVVIPIFQAALRSGLAEAINGGIVLSPVSRGRLGLGLIYGAAS